MVTFQEFNIKIPNGATGNIKTICPSCTPHTRKPENRKAQDLSVNVDEGVWNCWNCGWKGSLKAKEEKQYQKPVTIELPLSQKTIEWFAGRGIKENTLKAFAITERMEWMPQEGKEMKCILFPYKRNGEWVNVKYRDGKKNFKLTKDAELIIFNYDGVKDKKRVIITEGEIDAMSAYQCGIYDVCSVPNGAAKGNQRLEYLDNSWGAFAEAEEIILATDNDEAGMCLKNELVRRLGKDRCLFVEYPEGCKDLNEVLVKCGMDRVIECIRKAQRFPVEGILRLTDIRHELDHVYEYGFEQGVTIGYDSFDECLNFSVGQLTVITGVPNSGKSAFLDQVLIRLASRHNWRLGVCSFENQPVTKHAVNLSGCYVGKPFYRRDPKEKMSQSDYMATQQFLQDNFFWFKMKDEDLTADGILTRAKQLVRNSGIKALVIDPWNYIEHKRKDKTSETEYISEMLSKLCNFAKDYEVHVFLVAHPTKIKKNPATKDFEIPSLYDISGSAHFFNKCDNGITVYRDRATNLVTVYIQKVRFFYNGKLGSAEFNFDVQTGRYKQSGEMGFYSELKKEYDTFTTTTPAYDNPHAGINPNKAYANHLPYKED